MKLRLTAVLLAALASLPCLAPAGQSASPSVAANVIQHELLVSYDLTGSTLAGPFNLDLEVFNDGTAKLSGVTNAGADARIANVGAATALKLARDLHDAGAWNLSDQPGTFSDVPLHTLTVLRGTANQKGHVFSYWIGINEYATVEQTLQQFIAVHFPGF